MNIAKKLAIAATAVLWSVVAHAAYPERTITIVVGFPAGGSTDVVARLLGQELSERLGKPVVIENMPGATGKIASMNVMKAPPDGYRVLMTAAGPHGTMPALAASMSYDPVKDFTPIVAVAEVPNVIIVNPQFPASNLQELIAHGAEVAGQIELWVDEPRFVRAHGRRAFEEDGGHHVRHHSVPGRQPAADRAARQSDRDGHG